MATISRRQFLPLGASLAGGAVLSGCSLLSTSPSDEESARPRGSADRSVRESPMLSDLVSSGKLPPLKQRLPEEPLVVEPVSETGDFGGTLRTCALDRNWLGIQQVGLCGLMEWSATSPPRPTKALAAAVDVLAGGKTYEITLRKGVKWSDGTPFTTADLMFWYENILGNEEVTPVFPSWLVVGGRPARLTAVSDTVIRYEFAAPHGLFLRFLSDPADSTFSQLRPKHYLQKFHPDFVGKAGAEKQAKDKGFENWTQLFADRDDLWRNPDRPVLGAWKISQPAGAGSRAVAERNPYYWKVDPDGRQLPYIDEVSWVFLEQEPLLLRTLTGEIDLSVRYMRYQDAPLLLRNREKGEFRVLRWEFANPVSALPLNLSHPDPVLRGLFHDIDVRAALSMAINRDEMNKAMLSGTGVIAHPCGMEGNRYYQQGMGRRFLKYAPDRANQLLDEAGLDRRDSNGIRLMPDGRPLRVSVVTYDIGLNLRPVDALEFVKRYWADVGIDMRIDNVGQSRYETETAAGEYDIVCYPTACYLWDMDPHPYVPMDAGCLFAPNYGRYHASNGKEGLRPVGEFGQLIELYERLQQTVDEDAQVEVGRQILSLHDKNVWVIGLLGEPFQPVVATQRTRNVRARAASTWDLGYAGATQPAQLFLAS